MSRSIIAGIVAAVIAALTATAYFVTTSSQSDKVEREQRERVDRARRVVQQSSAIEGLNALHNIELLSRDPQLYDAITANTPASEGGKRDFNRLDQLAGLSFSSFVAGE